ncbi:dTDP-4-dehydrorhamnose 3,5-epimerase family protein, partial [Aeromonas caviae]|uniref:dTDP-4-dehydrorhamnose 3,5-epimerase family protein n=1 Tax=Aeromonas caviae TaxID=648 RepID=UPI002B45E64E
GFAHGFVTLSETAEFLYKTTNYYCVASDRGVAWNDEQLAVAWPIEGMNLILSDKDQKQPIFKLAEYF